MVALLLGVELAMRGYPIASPHIQLLPMTRILLSSLFSLLISLHDMCPILGRQTHGPTASSRRTGSALADAGSLSAGLRGVIFLVDLMMKARPHLLLAMITQRQ